MLFANAAYDNINLNLYMDLIFLDIKKAFNTIYHKNPFDEINSLWHPWSDLLFN